MARGGSGKDYGFGSGGSITVSRPDGTTSTVRPGDSNYNSTVNAMNQDGVKYPSSSSTSNKPSSSVSTPSRPSSNNSSPSYSSGGGSSYKPPNTNVSKPPTVPTVQPPKKPNYNATYYVNGQKYNGTVTNGITYGHDGKQLSGNYTTVVGGKTYNKGTGGMNGVSGNALGSNGYKQPDYSSAYDVDWDKALSGSYEGNQYFDQIVNGMQGKNPNDFKDDWRLQTLYSYMNGNKEYGKGEFDKYNQFTMGNTTAPSDRIGSINDQTVDYLYNMYGKDYMNTLGGMSQSELAKELNSKGFQGVTVDTIKNKIDMMNSNNVMNPTSDKAGYLDFIQTTNMGDRYGLGSLLAPNYSMKQDGSIGLNDKIVNVDGQQMHLFNLLKYGEQGQDDMYDNILKNEQAFGTTQNVPLKYRAEKAPDTMTPEMKKDLDYQLELEGQISALEKELGVSKEEEPQVEEEVVQEEANPMARGTSGGSGGYIPNGAMSGIGGGGIESYLDMQRGYGKGAQFGTSATAMTPQQIAYSKQMSDAIARRVRR